MASSDLAVIERQYRAPEQWREDEEVEEKENEEHEDEDEDEELNEEAECWDESYATITTSATPDMRDAEGCARG